MHSKCDNIEIMINNKSDEVIGELFQLLLFRYQIGSEIRARVRDSVFDSVNLLYYKCHKIHFY